MIARKLWWIAGGVLLASALVSATVFAWQPWRSPDLLTEQQVQTSVLEQYPGEIMQSKRHGELYLIRLQSEQGTYEMEVGAADGAIVAIQRLNGPGGGTSETDHGAHPELTPAPLPPDGPSGETGAGDGMAKPPATGSPVTQPPGTQPPVTEAPATKPPGTKPTTTNPPATQRPAETTPPATQPPVLLTEQQAAAIALKHVKGSGQVEDVQRGNDDDYLVDIEMTDGREAVVQVNMISGKILSITWDDDDDDDDGDSDTRSGDDDDD
ncbi:PepSY domain-containing protein [Paenibacillus chungangensis]|uniref:PepSY domain-containing protein n=1 Tax=Paenibacillus chungangensis TaxID=696535 RepID=A0ABW3HLE9_9BACL